MFEYSPSGDVEAAERKALRQFLYKVLPDDTAIQSFCQDCFPEVERRLSNGMGYEQRINLLLLKVEPRDIVQELDEHHDYHEAVRRYLKLLPRAYVSITVLKGRFELEVDTNDRLGKGGMGIVYGARERHTDRRWAVKILKKEAFVEQDRAFQRRFEREARVSARINHPNVVQIVATGVSEHGPWLAMERLEGEDMAAYLKRHQLGLPLSEVNDIMKQLCDVLAAVHKAGIVHRDLKPENIFLTRSRETQGVLRQVKLLDLGLARFLEESQTQTQGHAGTQEYMAPEQQCGLDATPATDVWALGLLAFRMVYGHSYGPILPEGEILASQRAVALGLAARNSAIPSGFDDWIAGCLKSNSKHRYVDAEEAYQVFALKVMADSASAGALQPLVNESPNTPIASASSDCVAPPSYLWVFYLTLPIVAVVAAGGGYLAGSIRSKSTMALSAKAPPMASVSAKMDSLDLDAKPILAVQGDLGTSLHNTIATQEVVWKINTIPAGMQVITEEDGKDICGVPTPCAIKIPVGTGKLKLRVRDPHSLFLRQTIEVDLATSGQKQVTMTKIAVD